MNVNTNYNAIFNKTAPTQRSHRPICGNGLKVSALALCFFISLGLNNSCAAAAPLDLRLSRSSPPSCTPLEQVNGYNPFVSTWTSTPASLPSLSYEDAINSEQSNSFKQDIIKYFQLSNVGNLERWHHDPIHSTNSHQLMLQGAKLCSNKHRAIILAPGRLEPIDEIANLFEEVVLVGYAEDLKERLNYKQKNVKFKTLDLTGNKINELSKFYQRAIAEKIPEDELVAQLFNFLEVNQKQSLKQFEELGGADLVISSNLLSQLSRGFDQVLNELHKKVYSHSLAEYIVRKYRVGDRSTYFTYKKVIEVWDAALEQSHIQSLHALVMFNKTNLDQRVVYLADTYQSYETTFASDGEKHKSDFYNLTSLSNIQSLLRHLFNVKKSKTWVWESKKPDQSAPLQIPGKSWRVKGFLLTVP